MARIVLKFGGTSVGDTDRIKNVARKVKAEVARGNEVAHNLSYGDQRRLEIARALATEPKLLALDEPVAGMSAKERDQTAELLNQICQNRSVLVIEHDMEFVKKIADKVTVMHQGKILAEGSMDQVQADERVIEVYLGR